MLIKVMPTRFPCILLCLMNALLLAGQVPDEIVRVGPGVSPPRLLSKVEPQYSPLAQADRIQGTVVLQIVVNDQGKATDINVISPLGYGLDEEAQTAVATWKFAPGMKDGKPVKILAIVEVNFRFPEIWFDEKAERRRTEFNQAIQSLGLTGAKPRDPDKAVKSLQDLAAQKFPPAMHLVGLWQTKGEHVAADPEGGLALIQKAAAKNFGPSIYELAVRRIEGRDLPKDAEKGFEKLRQASILGSVQAQFYLGNLYEKGIGVPAEPNRARRYFTLCSARGVALCQYRLGNLLLNSPARAERDYMQAVAWLQLAGEQGLREAAEAAQREIPRLSSAQVTWVTTLKTQLVRK